MSKSKVKSKRTKARSANAAASKVKKQKLVRKPRTPKYIGETLSKARQKDLKRLERTIAKSLAGFVNIGFSLRDIQKKKLYKATHSRFEEYCKSRWDFSVKHAYRFIAAAEIVEKIKAGEGQVSPKNLPKRESQVRPLVRLCRASRCKPTSVWDQALKEAKGKAPSAALVSRLVNERLGNSGSKASKKRGSAGANTLSGKIAKIRKLLGEDNSKTVGQTKKFYEQTLMKIGNLVGKPKA